MNRGMSEQVTMKVRSRLRLGLVQCIVHEDWEKLEIFSNSSSHYWGGVSKEAPRPFLNVPVSLQPNKRKKLRSARLPSGNGRRESKAPHALFILPSSKASLLKIQIEMDTPRPGRRCGEQIWKTNSFLLPLTLVS